MRRSYNGRSLRFLRFFLGQRLRSWSGLTRFGRFVGMFVILRVCDRIGSCFLSFSRFFNFFWRLEENDAVYVRGLNPLPGTAQVGGDFVAHTPSVSIDYQWNRHLSMDLSYSHFFIGEVIRNAGGSDVDFFKLQAEWKF